MTKTGLQGPYPLSFDAIDAAVRSKSAGVYALGIEPANCSILGRAHDIAAGRMPFLDPGEIRESWLTVEARLIA